VKRFIPLTLLLLVAAALLVTQRERLGLSVAYVKARLTPKATVEDRLRSYEHAARQRLGPVLQAKDFSYPLKGFALLAIKDASLLQLFAHDNNGRAIHIKDYPILAESGTLGPKLREGDGQIPEGIYKVNFLNANSLYHLSLRLNYPNEFDQQMARRDSRTQLGGDIMIHGKNVSIGCIAIGDPGIEEIFCLAARAGPQNVKVIIVPTDWRSKPIDSKASKGPVWLPELYATLKAELDQLR
jgi:murein L,D-transpeptidase YafK